MKKIHWLLCAASDKLNVPYTMFAVPDLSAGAPVGALQLGVYSKGHTGLQWITVPGAGTYCSQVMRERRQITLVSSPLGTFSAFSDALKTEPLTAYLGTPIPAMTGGAIGALSVLHSGPRIWSEENRMDATSIAQWLGRELAPPGMQEQQATAW